MKYIRATILVHGTFIHYSYRFRMIYTPQISNMSLKLSFWYVCLFHSSLHMILRPIYDLDWIPLKCKQFGVSYVTIYSEMLKILPFYWTCSVSNKWQITTEVVWDQELAALLAKVPRKCISSGCHDKYMVLRRSSGNCYVLICFAHFRAWHFENNHGLSFKVQCSKLF